jgi:enamine deaminase RidA (YjgF/YER057c/UK114 family)
VIIEEKLKGMGLELPVSPKSSESFVPLRQVNSIVFVSGTTANINGDHRYLGKLGDSISLEEGYKSARDACLVSLAHLKRGLGSLDLVKRVLKLTVFVNVTSNFMESAKVANGASELLIELYGEDGKHARSAIGVQALPGNKSVEVEMVVEVTD